MRCANPDCFYLHEAGSQEDRYTKEQLTLACASKLQQHSRIALDNFNWRSGSVLPPPIDNFCSSSNISTSKSLGHSAVHCARIDSKNSPRNCDNGRTGALPVSTSCESRITSTESRIAPTMTSSSSMSSTAMKANVPAQPWDTNQSNEQIVSSINDMPLSIGLPNKLASSNSYAGKGYTGDSIMSNSKASVETNIVIKDSTGDQKSLPYSSDSNSISCCTADKTGQITPCCCSWCQDSTSDSFYSAIESPNTSRQDTPLPLSSETRPLSSHRSRGCSDLEATGSASNFEAKNNSLSFCNRLPRASSTLISDKAIIGHKVCGECSKYSTVSIGLSPKEGQEMFHTNSSCCDTRDSELQYLSCSEKSISAGKDMIQGSGVLDKVNGVISKEDSIGLDKFSLNLDSLKKFSLDLGLVEHIEPHSLPKMFRDANTTGKSSRSYNPCISSDSNEYISSARMDSSDDARRSISLSSDLLDPRKNPGQLDSGGKKAFDSNKFNLGLSVYDSNKPEMMNSKHSLSATKIANESEHTWSFHHSASPVSRSEVPPPPRHPPPGFSPIHVADGRPFSLPSYSGSTDQYHFPGSPIRMNSTEKLFGSNNYADFELSDPEKLVFRRAKPPQSTIVGSNLGSQWTQFESRLGDLTQNSVVSVDQSTGELVKNIALQEVMKNYYGHRESCIMGSASAAVSGVMGSQLKPHLEHDELKFETPSFSYFHYSQFGRI